MSSFKLDPRLEADTVPVADLPFCVVRLMKDANHPWLVLVPRQPGLVEIVDLSKNDRGWLMDEIAHCSEVLKRLTGCDKLNVAALGNQVAQLHVHVIARFRTDPAWPAPVWGTLPPAPYEPARLLKLVDDLKTELAKGR